MAGSCAESMSQTLVGDDGRMTHIYAVRNPNTLARLDEPAPLEMRRLKR